MKKAIEELAELIHERDNPKIPEITFGKVVECAPPRVQLPDNNVILSSGNMRTLVNLSETDGFGHYTYLGKTVALIPYLNCHKYLVLGAVVA